MVTAQAGCVSRRAAKRLECGGRGGESPVGARRWRKSRAAWECSLNGVVRAPKAKYEGMTDSEEVARAKCEKATVKNENEQGEGGLSRPSWNTDQGDDGSIVSREGLDAGVGPERQ